MFPQLVVFSLYYAGCLHNTFESTDVRNIGTVLWTVQCYPPCASHLSASFLNTNIVYLNIFYYSLISEVPTPEKRDIFGATFIKFLNLCRSLYSGNSRTHQSTTKSKVWLLIVNGTQSRKSCNVLIKKKSSKIKNEVAVLK